ncbi:DUF2914 domain-containing protein [Candidatus Finniella inopinata]|uniref:DUF2914 domain-containing protein n=1 Tax=Candidatus Finniella inopinata TaxID=1696036 RepID=A0A4Q7DEN3_9PROT|nr:DUF2914 domain-containing protein [Candidatus Finniella inopinata]RZI45181.1 DUF2914 domain-containing protein [Candidatus Finniella inopinata]
MFLRFSLMFCSLIAVAQATQPSASPAALGVNRFVLSTGIENREPINPKENFSTVDGKVVAFADLSASADETVTFIWTHNDKVHTQWSTHVAASPRFRTHAAVQARPGKWSVKVQDSKGAVLKEQSFEVSQSGEHVTAAEPGKPVSEATAKLAKKITKAPSKGVKETLSSLEPKNEKPAEPEKKPVAETKSESAK